jgi:hypothetical protein
VLAGSPVTPSLAATTVLTATRSGYVDVLVPADARLSPQRLRNPDVSFTGSGRMLGAWLVPADPARALDDSLEVIRRPAFLGGRTATSGSTEPRPQCSGGPLGSCTSPEPKAIVLHKGLYRLTVLTDGHPVRLVLHLHGLAPTTTRARPAHALASAELALPTRETVGDRSVTYGATGPFGGRVLTFVAATATTSGTQLDGWSLCERRDRGTTAPFAYSPACPGGTQGGYDIAVREGTYGVFGAWSGGLDDSAPAGLGGSFTNDAGVALGQTLGVWLRVP